jgi:hypothetical protein
MTDLARLYQRMTAAATESVDADALARLAAGQHVGEGHDAAVAALSRSATDATALRIALEQASAAEALARGLRGAEVVALAPRRAAVRWLAMAAGVAAIALVATFVVAPQRGVDAPPAVATATDEDAIFTVSFEGAIAATDEGPAVAPAGDDIFSGEFDS